MPIRAVKAATWATPSPPGAVQSARCSPATISPGVSAPSSVPEARTRPPSSRTDQLPAGDGADSHSCAPSRKAVAVIEPSSAEQTVSTRGADRSGSVPSAGAPVAAMRHSSSGPARLRPTGNPGARGGRRGGGEVVAGEPAEPVGAAAQHDGVPDERERGALEAAGREAAVRGGGGGIQQEHLGGGAGGAHQAAPVGGEREHV